MSGGARSHADNLTKETGLQMPNTDEIKGRVKEAAGDLTDDADLKANGRTDRAAGKVKDVTDDLKDKVDDVVDHIKNEVHKG